MAGWVETYRGGVPTWECDVTEHFTIAYYFDRIDEAAATLAEHLGLAAELRAGGFRRDFDVRFVRELRAGASFHIESAPLASDATPRFGHRVCDSATGEPVTWFEERWDDAPLPADRRSAIAGSVAEWTGPAIEKRPEPPGDTRFTVTGRGRVKPGDIDAHGRFSVSAYVHRFSSASLQMATAIGMDSAHAQSARRGFSTFELGLRILAAPTLGIAYQVETAIVHLGSSSMRYMHRMSDPQTGQELAHMGQFGVQLDLDARRPAPLSPEIRERATRLMATPT